MSLYVNNPPGSGSGFQWFNSRIAEMQAVIPQLTGYSYIDFAGNYGPSAVAPTFDGSTEGGAVSPLASGASTMLGHSIFQTPKTGKGAIVFRAKFSALGVGDVSEIGLRNAAGTRIWGIFMQPPATNTHYQLETTGSATQATTIVDDNAWHNFMLAWNGTNAYVYVDNVLGLTSASLFQADDPVIPFMINVLGASTIRVSRIAAGYIMA